MATVEEQQNEQGGATVKSRPQRERIIEPLSKFLEEDEYSPEEYEQLLSMYEDTLTNIEEGEIVKAKVLRVTENAVILDVGFKSEGSISRDEFKNPDQLEPGEEVEVFLENLEDSEGVVVLSKKKADFLRVWEKIKTAYEENEIGRAHV